MAAVTSCENTLLHYLCFIYGRKFYAGRHVKITQQWKSTLITGFLSRAQKGSSFLQSSDMSGQSLFIVTFINQSHLLKESLYSETRFDRTPY